jgi:peptide-methionine (R)-S-oxide reductase
MTEKIVKSDAEWKAELTPEQYYVTRKHGTERPFTSPLNDAKGPGTFTCVACGAPLFDADAKFDSSTGWPSFFKPITPEAVGEHSDRSFFMRRTEIRCARCDSHLGHVFPDGPPPTGLRYCMNGVAMELKPNADAA